MLLIASLHGISPNIYIYIYILMASDFFLCTNMNGIQSGIHSLQHLHLHMCKLVHIQQSNSPSHSVRAIVLSDINTCKLLWKARSCGVAPRLFKVLWCCTTVIEEQLNFLKIQIFFL